MFLGLRTAIYHVDDIAKGKAWYAQVLGIEPYFDQPFYVGFNAGGYELGLQPSAGPAGERLMALLLTGASRMPKRRSNESLRWELRLMKRSRMWPAVSK